MHEFIEAAAWRDEQEEKRAVKAGFFSEYFARQKRIDLGATLLQVFPGTRDSAQRLSRDEYIERARKFFKSKPKKKVEGHA